jgi:hypothetical protein
LAIVITVTCEGLDHRLEFREDGEVVMLDHSEKLVRSFVAFGAKPPECMEEIDKARQWPIDYLFDHLKVDKKTIVLLACDFAEHVLPIWKKYHPDDDRPKEAIQAARKYVAGEIKLSTLNRAESAAAQAAAEADAAADAAAAAADVAAAWSGDAAWAAAWAERAASASEWAAYHHAEAHGNDPDAAKAAEKKWQVSRMVQVLEVISRGEDPWQS